MTDLNLKHKTIKLLEDNKGKNLGDLGCSNDFSYTTPKAWPINKQTFIIKNCSAKDTVKTIRQATDKERMFAEVIPYLTKVYYPKYIFKNIIIQK